MKEYRLTSADFVPEGETGDPDAFMDPAELHRLKKLAGLVTEDYYTAGGHDPELTTSNDSNGNPMSPVGSNISITGMEKRELEKRNNIKPGTPEWFQLWFTLPYLTGTKPIGDAPAHRIKNDAERKKR